MTGYAVMTKLSTLMNAHPIARLNKLRDKIRRIVKDSRARSDLLGECDAVEEQIRKARAESYEAGNTNSRQS